MPTLRAWRAGDPVLDHIATIYREFDVTFDAAFESDLLDVGADYAEGAFWVAEQDGRLVGTVGVVPNGDSRLIRRIYVAAAARRQGLARRLLRHACGWGTFARSELWSDLRFGSAHQLYLSEGFEPGPTRTLDDPDRSVERYFSRSG